VLGYVEGGNKVKFLMSIPEIFSRVGLDHIWTDLAGNRHPCAAEVDAGGVRGPEFGEHIENIPGAAAEIETCGMLILGKQAAEVCGRAVRPSAINRRARVLPPHMFIRVS